MDKPLNAFLLLYDFNPSVKDSRGLLQASNRANSHTAINFVLIADCGTGSFYNRVFYETASLQQNGGVGDLQGILQGLNGLTFCYFESHGILMLLNEKRYNFALLMSKVVREKNQ